MILRRLLVSACAAACAAAPGAAAQPAPLAGACASDLEHVNHMSGWQAMWLRRRDGGGDGGAAALREAAAGLDAVEAALSDGRGVAPRAVVRRVLDQLDAVLALGAGDEATLARVRAHRAFLEETYLPRAPETSALMDAADPEACFLAAAATWFALDADVAGIEDAGRRLLDEFGAQFLARSGAGEAALAERLAALRDAEPEPLSGAELVAVSAAAVARAHAAVPDLFARDAVTPVAVEPMEAAAAESFPAGYYRNASDGGPAYVINTSRAPERRLMAEAIAFHETVPGHHLGVELAQGRGRYDAGFAEGWATYAEYLADEHGLYGSDADRLGATAKRLWSASRLVVEPGLHAHGWTRDEAVDFMLAHTALPRAEIEIEVDRYLAWPGQSLSYSLGFDRIRALRAEAEAALGEAFDLRAFHAVVLDPGSRPLAHVAEDVAAWIAEQAG